jgi:hypothetical protein
MSGISALKDNIQFQEGYALGKKLQDPSMRFLWSLGYTSFNYTDGKVVDAVEAHRCPMSSDVVVRDILFGNLKTSTLKTLLACIPRRWKCILSYQQDVER